MRKQITLFEDQYQFYKELKSKRLLVAFVEYMFEDIEPIGLNGIEKVAFNSLKNRMENSKKIHDGNSKGGTNSRGGGRPRNTNSDLHQENKSKTTQKQVNKQVEHQVKNNEEEDNNILSYDNIYSAYYGKNKGIDEKVCNKLIDTKLKQGITLDDINKSMVLYNCECRLKQDFKFVKKFETWIKEFQKPTEEQIDEELYVIIKSFRDKKKSDDKFGKSTPAQTLRNDLKETFGDDKVKGLRKQANSIQLNFT